ncbi:MAG: DUF2625 family protein [Lutisporaceae bacterium]
MSQLWNEVFEMLIKSPNNIHVEKLIKYDNNILKKLDINENSVLGQIIANTSGIIVDNYIRVFANGDGINFQNIYTYNRELEKYFGNKILIVADDIWGGLYAINNGGFSEEQGKIWYFAPDTLKWDNLELSYPEFIAWISSNNLNEFYNSYKWVGFQKDIAEIKYNQGILIYPFLWSSECNIDDAEKKVVSFNELILLNLDYKKKFNL